MKIGQYLMALYVEYCALLFWPILYVKNNSIWEPIWCTILHLQDRQTNWTEIYTALVFGASWEKKKKRQFNCCNNQL